MPPRLRREGDPRRRRRARPTSTPAPTPWSGSTRPTSTGCAPRSATASSARWVQLPFAGVERLAAAGLLDPGRAWTSAKGAYAEPVAEHALMLALAGLRLLRRRITRPLLGQAGRDRACTTSRSRSSAAAGSPPACSSLLAPLRVTATVVRQRPDPVPGAARTVGQADLHEALADAQVVFLALALTPSTEHIIGAAELAAMRPDAWLVNVARGRHRRHRRAGRGAGPRTPSAARRST